MSPVSYSLLPLQHSPQLTVLFAHPLVESVPIAKPEVSGGLGIGWRGERGAGGGERGEVHA